jgi:hypothetical protein
VTWGKGSCPQIAQIIADLQSFNRRWVEGGGEGGKTVARLTGLFWCDSGDGIAAKFPRGGSIWRRDALGSMYPFDSLARVLDRVLDRGVVLGESTSGVERWVAIRTQ